MVLKLSDIKSRMIPVTITTPDGYKETVTIGSLSYVEWNNCAIGIEFPSIPTVRRLTEKGQQDVPNYDDPSYRNALVIAEATISFRRVVASLIKGGNFPELKDKSLDEQCEELEGLDVSIIRGVMQALSQIQLHTRGGIDAKKATFQDEQIPQNA